MKLLLLAVESSCRDSGRLKESDVILPTAEIKVVQHLAPIGFYFLFYYW